MLTKSKAPKGLLEETIGAGALREDMRAIVREALIEIAEEELAEALGADRYQRTGTRQGYRHGTVTRQVTTSTGRLSLELPRARVRDADGATAEWRPAVVSRYQRRTADVDDAILRCYLGGVNTRKIAAVLQPLCDPSALSKSAVSRITGRLQSHFEAWQQRTLADEHLVALFLDAFYVKVRHGKRLDSVPVLAAIGVRDTGERVLLHLAIGGSESAEAWRAFLEQLVGRGLKAPKLVVIDGHKGLRRAVREVWPRVAVQRCTVHKAENLKAACPKRLHDELHADYRAVIYAESAAAVRTAHAAFRTKWRKLCPAVVASLDEAGDELLTFLAFPKACWKALRTTNGIERLNGEFRRRVKTQGQYPTDDAALVLLFGLVASGLVKIRRIVGHTEWVRHWLQPEEQVA